MKKTFIPLIAAALLVLAACNQTPPASSAQPSSEPAPSSSQPAPSSEPSSEPAPSSEPSSEPAPSSEPSSQSTQEGPVLTSLSIKDKDTIKVAHQYDLPFTIDIETDPEINVLLEIRAGRLTVTSDDEEVIACNGLGLTVGKPGKATVTVAHSSGVSDSVEITVEAMVESSLADIIAMEKGKVVNFFARITGIYKGTLANTGVFVGNGEYGIMLYKSELSGDLHVGDDVLVTGATTSPYNGLPELTGANIRKMNVPEGKIVAPVDIEIATGKTPALNTANSSRHATVKDAKIKQISVSDKTYDDKPYQIISGTVTVDETDYPFYMDGRYCTDKAMASWKQVREGQTEAELVKPGDEVELDAWSYVNNNKGQFVNGGITKWVEGKEEITPAVEPAPVHATIADLNKLTADVTDKIYAVSGIFEAKKGDEYGNGYLTDPVTGETIMVYGATTTATAIAFDGASGEPVFSYTNPKDAKTTLADYANGDLVIAKVLFKMYNKTAEACCVFIDRIAAANVASTYKVILPESEGGTVAASKIEGLKYGEEVTLTVTPASGKQLKKITVENAQGVKTDVTETLKFNATCVNKIAVEFEDAGAVLTQSTLNVESLGITGGYGDYSAKIDGADWTVYQSGSYGDGIQMRYNKSKNQAAGAVYNTTATAAPIKSVTFNYNAAKLATNSSENQLYFAFGNTSQAAATSGTNLSFTKEAPSVKIDMTAKDITFIKFAHAELASGSYTTYLSSVVIEYDVGGEDTPAAKILPIVNEGNSATRIEGAGAMINLDNSKLGINGANAQAIHDASEVKLAVSYTGEDAAPKAFVEGGVNIVSFQFDDYNAEKNTVRLYVVMDKGAESPWGVRHEFDITLVIGEDTYKGAAAFVGNAYVPADA